MRHVRFGGAMSLDGYIAGPNGEYDWIVMDPDIDFAAMSTVRHLSDWPQDVRGHGADGRGAASDARYPEHRAVSRTLEARGLSRVTIERDAERRSPNCAGSRARTSRSSAAASCSAACWPPAWSTASNVADSGPARRWNSAAAAAGRAREAATAAAPVYEEDRHRSASSTTSSAHRPRPRQAAAGRAVLAPVSCEAGGCHGEPDDDAQANCPVGDGRKRAAGAGRGAGAHCRQGSRSPDGRTRRRVTRGRAARVDGIPRSVGCCARGGPCGHGLGAARQGRHAADARATRPLDGLVARQERRLVRLGRSPADCRRRRQLPDAVRRLVEAPGLHA